MVTPYMVFFHVGPSPMHTMRAPLNVLDRTYQVSIFHERQSMALSIADALRHRLDGYKGGYQGICFGGVFYRAQTSGYDVGTKLFQIVTEWRVVFRFMDVTKGVKVAIIQAVEKECQMAAGTVVPESITPVTSGGAGGSDTADPGVPAFGTEIQVMSACGPPEAFETIMGVGDISGPNTSVAETETTSHSTGSAHRTFVPTLIDDGEISFPCFWNPSDPTQSLYS